MQTRLVRSCLLAVILSAASSAAPAEDTLAPQPNDPDLLLWLDASGRDTLTLDAGGRVSQWKSKSLSVACTLTADGPQRPTWSADAWQDKPAVCFDGQDDVLRNTQFGRSAKAWTVLMVVCPRSNKGSGIPDGFHCFLSANEPGSQDFVSGLNVDMGGRQTDRFVWLNVESSQGDGEANLLQAGSDFGQPRVVAVCADARQTTLFAEAVQQGARSSSAAATSLAELRVGSRCYFHGRETGFVHADIAEVIIYSRALATEQLQAISRYLQEKYAVPNISMDGPRMSLDEALAALRSYDWERSRLWLLPIDEIVRGRDRAAWTSLEQSLCAALREGVSPAAVDAVCRRLEVIGTSASVPALAELLRDSERRAAALRALQQIPVPEAGEALLDALEGADASLREPLIRALGDRREARAVGLLVRLLQDDDAAIRAAVGEALAQLGDPGTTDVVLALPDSSPRTLLVFAANLAAAQHTAEALRVYAELDSVADDGVQAAVLRGRVRLDENEAARRLLAALRGDNARLRGQAAYLLAHECAAETVAAVSAQFRTVPAEAQASLLGVRWLRLPEAGRQLALEALKLDSAQLRCEGLRLVTHVGGADDVAVLARVCAEDGEQAVRSAAELALAHLAAPGTDEAIIEQLASASMEARRALVRAASNRRLRGAESVLVQIAASADEATRVEALTALQQLGSAGSLPSLIDRLFGAATTAERNAAERAVWLCALRREDSVEPVAPVIDAYQRATAEQRPELLPVLGRLGGARAAEILDAALASDQPSERAAAVRGWANWPDATAADRLLVLAREADVPAQRVWALRAYIRVVSLPDPRSPQLTVRMLQDAWPLATRDDERNLILQRLPAAVCVESLQVAVGHLEDSGLQAQAVATASQLAESLLPIDPQAARSAIEKILTLDIDPALRTRLSRHVPADR